jgi:4-amino-4-deoxy-L-arabinose transferase-like glycosyltransferase
MSGVLDMNLWWLAAEGLLVGVAGWLGWRAMAPRAAGVMEHWLGWGVVGMTAVVAAGVVLGATGRLGAPGFLSLHVLLVLCLGFYRRKFARQDGESFRQLLVETVRIVRSEPVTLAGTLGLGLFILVTGIMAAMAEPVVYDALTYRLSRIGHWLQEGRVTFLTTNDPRQNYMPVVPDLTMAWLIAGGEVGWRPVALAQWWGGVLLLLATIGFARAHGLGRNASLGAAILCAGLANVAPQFTTPHTDLLTAGLVAAALALWLASASRREGSWTAGLGAGLALGAKGTIFYFLPVLVLWVVWRGWRLSLPIRAWMPSAVALVVATLWFATPGWVQNYRHYGSGLGPPEFVSMHHQGGGNHLLKKTGLNLATTALQNLEPHSQPPGLGNLTAAWGNVLARWLPVDDGFTYDGLDRQNTLGTLFARTSPDADVLAFGVIVPVLFLAGMAVSRTGRRPYGVEIWWLGMGVLGFLVFFHAMQQWHPYAYRYFLLVVPWLTVVAAWGIAGLPGRLPRAIWVLALGSAVLVGGHTLARTHQAGWLAVTQPDGSRGHFVAASWARWARTLDQPDEPLRLALPFNQPLAGFYRNGSGRPVRPVELGALTGLTAEEVVDRLGPGWLIVQAATFLGNEGSVHSRVLLHEGDPENAFSLAAYRGLENSEVEPVIVYRHRVEQKSTGQHHDLLVRAGPSGEVTVEVTAKESGRIQIVSPLGLQTVHWEDQGGEFKLRLPAGQVAEVNLAVSPREGRNGFAETVRINVR